MEIKELGEGRFSLTSRGACVWVYLKDELERFAECLSQNGCIISERNEAELKETIEKYTKQYEKFASRKNPVFI